MIRLPPAVTNFRINQLKSRRLCARHLRKPANVISTADVHMLTTSRRCSNSRRTCGPSRAPAIIGDSVVCWVENARSCILTPHWRILLASNAKAVAFKCSSNTQSYCCCRPAVAAPYSSSDSYSISVLMLTI
jgi:hypothetical protein